MRYNWDDIKCGTQAKWNLILKINVNYYQASVNQSVIDIHIIKQWKLAQSKGKAE